jgi:hypothetical protein
MILSRIALPHKKGEHGRLDREKDWRRNLNNNRPPLSG